MTRLIAGAAKGRRLAVPPRGTRPTSDRAREGDVLGAAQSGRRSSFRLLSVLDDEDLIATARDAASDLVEADPDLASAPVLAAELAALAADERAEFLDKA